MPNVPDNRATAYFETHVLPSVEFWSENPLNLNLAMNAATCLNQMADYYFHQYGASEPDRVFGTNSVRQFRTELARRQPNVGLVRDVADAHKHVVISRTDRVLTSAAQFDIGSLGFGEAEFGVGAYGGVSEAVVELDSGERRHFSALVEDVTDMWLDLL